MPIAAEVEHADERLPRLIAARMAERGLSLRALARAAGVSHSTVSRMLSGRTRPTMPLLRAVAPVLGLPADELLGAAGLAAPDASDVLAALRALGLEPAPPELISRVRAELARLRAYAATAEARAAVRCDLDRRLDALGARGPVADRLRALARLYAGSAPPPAVPAAGTAPPPAKPAASRAPSAAAPAASSASPAPTRVAAAGSAPTPTGLAAGGEASPTRTPTDTAPSRAVPATDIAPSPAVPAAGSAPPPANPAAGSEPPSPAVPATDTAPPPANPSAGSVPPPANPAADSSSPSPARLAAGSAVLYFLNAADAIDDGMWPIGYLDDAVAVALAEAEVRRLCQSFTYS